MLIDKFDIAGMFLAAVFGVLFVNSMLLNHGAYFFAINIFIFSPFLMILRQYFISYNGVIILLFFSLILWITKNYNIFKFVIFRTKFLLLALFILIYTIYGAFMGVPVLKFIKFHETILAILIFLMLLTSINYFRKYVVFFILSSVLLVLSLSKYFQTRFFIQTDDLKFGLDPSSISVALTMSLIFVLIDNNFWIIHFTNKNIQKFKIFIVAFIISLIILSTSRVNFFVAIVIFIVYFFLEKQKFISFISVGVLAVLVFLTLKFSGQTKVSDKFFKKTFNNERGIEAATTGRSEMWVMTGFYLINSDILSILVGTGPGSGQDFTEEYSKKADVKLIYGKRYELHSLYLNVLVEFGFIAFIFFISFIITRLIKLFKFYKKYKTTIPFASFIAYLTYVFSVSGLGLVPGLLLSFSLINSTYILNINKQPKNRK